MDEWELDFDRFIYEEEVTFGGEVTHIRVGCRHRNTEPVKNALTGEPVATLCIDCDEQLPVFKGEWNV